MNQTFNRASLEVIAGTMFSGKSKALLERGHRASEYGNIDVYYFKPILDTRDKGIVSRNGMSKEAFLVKRGMDIFKQMEEVRNESMIIIDEGQFFDDSLIYAIQLLRLKGHNLIVAGLDRDFRGLNNYINIIRLIWGVISIFIFVLSLIDFVSISVLLILISGYVAYTLFFHKSTVSLFTQKTV